MLKKTLFGRFEENPNDIGVVRVLRLTGSAKATADPSNFCTLGVIISSMGSVQALKSISNIIIIVSSVRSSYSHPDLLLIHPTHPLFQITPVLNTGLSLSEPLQLYKGYNAI